MSCILCFQTLTKTDICCDFNLADCPKSKLSKPLHGLHVLVKFRPESRYICCECLRLLQKFDSAWKKVKVLADQAAKHYIGGAYCCSFLVKSRMKKEPCFPTARLKNLVAQQCRQNKQKVMMVQFWACRFGLV